MAEPYDPYRPPADPSVPDGPAPPAGHVSGIATGVQTRVEGGRDEFAESVLSFRLQLRDEDRPVDVELRAHRLTGAVRDGDHVSLPAPVEGSGLIRVSQLQNLTTGSTVGPVVMKGPLRVVFLVVFALILVAFVVAMVTILTPFGNGTP